MRQENNEDRMKVYLIGAGPGDPGLLTIKGKDILEKADVVVYDYLANCSAMPGPTRNAFTSARSPETMRSRRTASTSSS